MKNTAGIFMLTLFVTLSAQAVPEVDKRVPDLSGIVDQMQLDTEQARRLTELVQQHHQAMRAMRSENRKFRDEMLQIREQHRKELLSVLSYEQLYQFDRHMRQKHQKRRDRKNNPE